MKALQVRGPGSAEIIDVPEPVPAGDEALLRVRMIGMCGSDLNTFRGKNPLVTYPRIPGHEIAATIQTAPNRACGFAPGDNVTLSPYTNCGSCAACLRGRPNACRFNQTLGVQRDGALAEFIAVPIGRLYHAASLPVEALAMVEPLTVGFHAVARGRVSPPDTVAVFGAGGVGLGAIAAASGRMATLIAVDIDEAKLQLARAAGAAFTIHSEKESLHDRLQELTNGYGPDVVIEAIGLPSTFRAAVEEVAFTGRVVYIGYAKEPVAYETRLFVQKELDIMGSRNAVAEDFQAVIRMLQEGRFPLSQAISEIVPLAAAPDILTKWSEDPRRFSKILVQVAE